MLHKDKKNKKMNHENLFKDNLQSFILITQLLLPKLFFQKHSIGVLKNYTNRFSNYFCIMQWHCVTIKIQLWAAIKAAAAYFVLSFRQK